MLPTGGVFNSANCTPMSTAPLLSIQPIFFDSAGTMYLFFGYGQPTMNLDGTVQYGNGPKQGPFVGWYDYALWCTAINTGLLPAPLKATGTT